MYFCSDLWVGDADQIGCALDGDINRDRIITLDWGDFVLCRVHLPGLLPGADDPLSPEWLTEVAHELSRPAGRKVTFAAARHRHVAGPPDEPAAYGAFEMNGGWVDFFAGLDDLAVRRIGQRWARDVAAEVPPNGDLPLQEVELVDAVRLVGQMRDACRLARERGAAVVYSWN